MSCKIERRTERTALGHLVYVVAVISDSEKKRVRVFAARTDAERFEAEERARRAPVAA